MAVQLRAFYPEYDTDPRKQIITTADRFEKLVRFIASRDKFVFDYETSGTAWFKHAEAVGIGLGAWDDNGTLWSAYVPFRHRSGEQQLDIGVIGPAIRMLLASPNVMKICHNIKFEDHFSRKEGWTLAGPRYDTMVAARLYNDNEALKLEHRAEVDLGIEGAKKWEQTLNQEVRQLARANKMGVKLYKYLHGYSEVNVGLCGVYGCTDVLHTGWLHEKYEKWGVSKHYPRIWPTEMELTRVLCDMEQTGMPVDTEYLNQLRGQVQDAKARLEAELSRQLGGHVFNPGSDDEVRELLKWMGLPLEKRTKGNQLSVDKEVLDQFSDHNVVVKLLLDWREADKIDTTYTASILNLLDANNVVHGNLKQVGTNTGRLSCEEPNYQNMPSENDDRAIRHSGKKVKEGGVDPWSIRRGYPVRGVDWVRLFLDYSQIELRVLGHYSKDPIMVGAFINGEDIHDRTAKEVGAILQRECPRRVAKVVNFGLSYCMSEIGLHRQAKVPLDEAEHFLAAFFQRYRGVERFRLELWAQARRDGCQWNNLFGRTRRLPDLRSETFWRKKRAERQMVASAIQGTAAELTKESLVRIDRWLRDEKIPGFLVNTVHDEIQIDVPREYAPVVAKASKALMEAYPEFDPIPIITDCEISETNWAEKHGYKVAA